MVKLKYIADYEVIFEIFLNSYLQDAPIKLIQQRYICVVYNKCHRQFIESLENEIVDNMQEI